MRKNFNYPYTCSEIDNNIQQAEKKIERVLFELLGQLNSEMPEKEVAKLAENFAFDIY